ncbi:MAG: metallopeptidase TldD-related protein [Mesotoga sp.]|uniref:metallopeptidase TldD-related protein n=1 Tax=Mesotoga sp. TaxID=2053577 RepID=UPI00262794D3|nr:metallopeptidase TldD-related protein [Mesotoga sp.]MDD2332831.1 metallopeptidase TldD-related protein [Mesotoga sp.]MDD5682518.1 metallopeptidase TldD-related protein [Mesotoga sp.]
MTEEKLVVHYIENAVKIVQTRVSSLRKKDVLRTSVRLYDGKTMGVAGSLGECDEKELNTRAKRSLELGIPYPSEATKDLEREEYVQSDLQNSAELLEATEEILERLRIDQPEFSFSHIFRSSKIESQLRNNLGLNLKSSRESVSLSLVIKDKKSSNIIDAITGYEGRKFQKKRFIELTNMICDAYKNQLEGIEEGEYPVVFMSDDITYYKKLYESLNGMLFATGGSLLSGKTDMKVFSEKVTLLQTRNIMDGFNEPFFDSEGTVNDADRFALIENGVVRSPYTDKKTASTYSLPLTGSAGGEFDGLPELGTPMLKFSESEETIKQLLGGQKGIFVLIASGGDFTQDGHFATPAQLAFLFDGERFIGRLPEISISSHLYDMFGKDFRGVSSNDFLGLENAKLTVMNMKVEKL